MDCPTCFATLRATSSGHACPDGHGAFVHRGDWCTSPTTATLLRIAGSNTGAGVACPGCRKTTARVRVDGEPLDVCTRCWGAWADRRAAAKPRARSAGRWSGPENVYARAAECLRV